MFSGRWVCAAGLRGSAPPQRGQCKQDVATCFRNDENLEGAQRFKPVSKTNLDDYCQERIAVGKLDLEPGRVPGTVECEVQDSTMDFLPPLSLALLIGAVVTLFRGNFSGLVEFIKFTIVTAVLLILGFAALLFLLWIVGSLGGGGSSEPWYMIE